MQMRVLQKDLGGAAVSLEVVKLPTAHAGVQGSALTPEPSLPPLQTQTQPGRRSLVEAALTQAGGILCPWKRAPASDFGSSRPRQGFGK